MSPSHLGRRKLTGRDMALSSIADLHLRLEVSGDVIRGVLGGPNGWHLAEAASSPELLKYLRSEASDGLSGEAVSEWKSFGRLVAKAAFPEPIAAELRIQFRKGMVRLGFDVAPELGAIPWEYAYLDEDGIGALALNPGIRLYRVPSASPAKGSLSDTRGVLVALADPQSNAYPRLSSCEAEFKSVLDALAAPECKHLRAEPLQHATPKSLIHALESKRFGVFHFIGHGDVKPTGGVLVLEGSRARQESLLYEEELAQALLASGTQLVVLSSCVSAGLATSLGTQLATLGIPAVVGMQMPVSDVDAHLFSRALYSALVAGHSIEEGVYEGRMAIRGSGLGWGAPVLITADPEMKVFQPAASATVLRGNLPKPLTSFIGRAAQIADVVKMLETERLVILHGSGGIGKTRLSIEIGRAAGSRFANGVWQVQLDAISDPTQVVDAVASVFGIRDSSEKPIEERLFEFLSDQELLIFLDNCEHLVPACRDLSVRILQSCPGVSILATSRDVLGTGAETVVPIPSLSFPEIPEDETHLFPVEETVRDYEAIQLLVARAKSAHAGFTANESNIEALCRIAKRLDGIPLALELAASRVRTFSIHQILERLLHDISWLDLEISGTPPRQKTLRAALDWSYGLLSQDEKCLFSRLGVFQGSFSMEAAEFVCGFAPLKGSEIANLLSSLVDKSLVVAEDHLFDRRYKLLDTCRDYAVDVLRKTQEIPQLRDNLLDYTCTKVEDLDGLARKTEGGMEWQTLIAEERTNVASALEWGLSKEGRAVKAAQLVTNCMNYWLMVGRDLLVAEMSERALVELPESEELLRARLTLDLGWIHAASGSRETLQPMLEALKVIEKKYPDSLRLARHRVGNAAYDIQEDEVAAQVFTAILDECRLTGNIAGEGSVQRRLAYIEIDLGHYESARNHLLEFIEKKMKIGDESGQGLARCILGYLESLTGGRRAVELYAKSMRMLIPIPEYPGLPDYLCLASSIFLESEASTAARLQGFARKIGEEFGWTPERFVTNWSREVERKTREAVSDYDRWQRDGRTMSRDEALQIFNEVALAIRSPLNI